MYQSDIENYELRLDEATFDLEIANSFEWAGDNEWEAKQTTTTRLPRVKGFKPIMGELILGAINGAFPGFYSALLVASKLCEKFGVTLGIGISFSGSGSAVLGLGVSGGYGLVVLPKFRKFGLYGSLSSFRELVATATGGGAVGASLTLLLTGIRGGLKQFSGRSVAIGIGGTVPGIGLTGSVQKIYASDGKTPIGYAAEVGGELGSEDVTGSIRGFISQTGTIAGPLNEFETGALAWDRSIPEEEFALPKSLSHARQILRKRGISAAKIKRAEKKLGLGAGSSRKRGPVSQELILDDTFDSEGGFVDDFAESFRKCMNSMGMPVPSSLFTTVTTTKATISALAAVVAKFGTEVTIAELVGAGTLPEALIVVGGLTAAAYGGACVGCFASALGETTSGGVTLADAWDYLKSEI